MLLTLYYVAATWLQSWRLNFMRSKIALVRKNNGSVLLYKDENSELENDKTATEDPEKPASTVRKDLKVQGIATSKFIPEGKLQVGDILWFTPEKKTISLFPMPVVDISEWISVSGGKSMFPIALKGSLETPLSELTRLHLLLEADFCAFHSQIYLFHVEDFGVPKAWHADNLFSLLIETDEDHLTRLATSFMLNSLSWFGHGLELIRIQSVEITGNPCLLLNSDWDPVSEAVSKKIGMPRRGMTATQWHNHVIMLRNFSQAAAEAVKKKDPVPVSGQRGSVIVRGPSPVTLSSPTTIDMQLVGDKETEEECPCPSSPSISLSVQRGSNSIDPSSVSTSSYGSIPRLSTDTLVAASPQSRNYGDRSGSITSLGSLSTASVCSNVQARVVIPHQAYATSCKPPNVIIFSESSISVESVKAALNSTLNNHRYTIYALNLTQMLSTPWLNQASLVVISGEVPATLTPRLLSYILQHNGHLLCLCSDLLGVFLPIFRTAEVRPDELVTFSYSSWKHVRMMHHIFCYQPSPTPAKFSQDEQSGVSGIPSSVEVLDNDKKLHKLDVQVLGAEETWRTPSLLSASTPSGGKIIFSQVHLEVDPLQYENDEIKLTELRGSNKARLEILTDILSKHLGLNCSPSGPDYKYTPAYFLGVNELKLKLLEKLKSSMQEDNTLKVGDLVVKFCGKNVTSADATLLLTPHKDKQLLPVLMYACPDTFSTVEYFENLATDKLGRLVIYSQVMTTSMALLSGPPLIHGLAVIPRIQTKGTGRGGNAWLSPEGCAMYSLQVHIPLNTTLGKYISLVQHLTALATVSAICSLPDLQGLDLGLKWPNDIYASRSVKVGGAVVSSTLQNGTAICNIGIGFNLNNKEPTTCVNEMISELNKKTGSKVPPLSFEKYFAITFTELERLMDLIQNGHLDEVILLYYKYWLHSNAEVSVLTPDGVSKKVTIVGIDNFGFLRVQDHEKIEFTVQPDGNSFDMLQGLIAPKIY